MYIYLIREGRKGATGGPWPTCEQRNTARPENRCEGGARGEGPPFRGCAGVHLYAGEGGNHQQKTTDTEREIRLQSNICIYIYIYICKNILLFVYNI